jgi:Putative transposase
LAQSCADVRTGRKAEPKELPFLRSRHRALCLVYLELESFLCDEALDARHHPMTPRVRCECRHYNRPSPPQNLHHTACWIKHRVAIPNSRLIALDDAGVTFTWKDYRAKGRERAKVMTLAIDEFIRRFLIHVLPSGFHRIRHYGLFANGGRAENIARARQLRNVPAMHDEPSDADGADDSESQTLSRSCPCCGGRMIIIEIFERGCAPQ